jgi:hypothetical protein
MNLINSSQMFNPIDIGIQFSEIQEGLISKVFNFNSVPIPTIEKFENIEVVEIQFRANFSKKLTWHKYTAYLERSLTRSLSNNVNQRLVIFPPINNILSIAVFKIVSEITGYEPIVLIYGKKHDLTNLNQYDLFLIDFNGVTTVLQ